MNEAQRARAVEKRQATVRSKAHMRTTVDRMLKRNAPADPAAETQTRIIERVKMIIGALELSLTEVSELARERHTCNINQAVLVDAIGKLRRVTNPPLPMPQVGTMTAPAGRVPTRLEHRCVNCFGPARLEIKGEWFCEDCAQ